MYSPLFDGALQRDYAHISIAFGVAVRPMSYIGQVLTGGRARERAHDVARA